MTPPAADDLLVADELLAAVRHLTGLVCEGVPGCDGASLTLLHGDDPETLAASHEFVLPLDGLQYGRRSGPCLTAMLQRTEVLVDDYSSEHRWSEVAQDMCSAGVLSSLSLPLSQGDEVVGGLNLYGRVRHAFGEDARTAAASFARQAVLTLGYLGRLHAERAALVRERQISATLQRSLLPVLPQLPGLTSAARYRVGSGQAQVGGDWYDLFALPDGAVGVAVGDVMGHDISAAAAMGQLRSVLRSYAYEGSSPSVVLDRLDRLVQDFEMAQLATAVYGRLVLDRDAAMLLFTNAGHPPPLMRGTDGVVSSVHRGTAPLIGVSTPERTPRGEGAVLLPAGCLLVLYTDGLVESRTRDVEQGIAQLSGVLAALEPGVTPEQACDVVLAEMVDDSHGDDAVLLVVRIDCSSAERVSST